MAAAIAPLAQQRRWPRWQPRQQSPAGRVGAWVEGNREKGSRAVAWKLRATEGVLQRPSSPACHWVGGASSREHGSPQGPKAAKGGYCSCLWMLYQPFNLASLSAPLVLLHSRASLGQSMVPFHLALHAAGLDGGSRLEGGVLPAVVLLIQEPLAVFQVKERN